MMILRCWLLAQDIAEKSTLQMCCRAAGIVFGHRHETSLPKLSTCLFACLLAWLFVCVMAYSYFMEPIGLTPADQLMCG
jgi:hypothetical protein